MINLMTKGLNETTHIKLNKEQQKALSFLCRFCNRLHPYEKKLANGPRELPFEYSASSSDFVKNVDWAMNLTSSDLFGIIWHLGGFSMRCYGHHEINTSINEYHPRAQESLICLMRVAQGQPTYYLMGGKKFLLRE